MLLAAYFSCLQQSAKSCDCSKEKVQRTRLQFNYLPTTYVRDVHTMLEQKRFSLVILTRV